MYTQALCGYCAAARSLLEARGVAFEEIDTTLKPSLRAEARQRSGRKTMPQIFVGDRHLGGYDDVAAMDKRGELDEILRIGRPDNDEEH